MSERRPGIAARLSIAPTRDERLTLYLVVAGASVTVGLFGGGLRVIVIALPFLAATALGVRGTDVARVATRFDVSATRCLEGDRLEGVLEVAAPSHLDIEIAIVTDDDALAPDDDAPWAWHVPAGIPRPVGLPVVLNANRWGRHPLGELRIRLVAPGSFFTCEATITSLPMIDVLPRAGRGDALVPLRSARAVVGAHRARRASSDGYEFAELAPYQIGDRVRDINWAATLRRDQPYVNRRTPELSGDLVLVLDSFPDALRRHSVVAREAIAWAGRHAWTIVDANLAANDRVGVAVEGARVRWLAPRTGRRARNAIFDMLVALTSSSVDRDEPAGTGERFHVPPGARVVAITPLARRSTTERLTALRTSGHDVETIAVDVGPLLTFASLPREVLRLRQLIFDERVASMRRHGVTVRIAVPNGPEASP